MENNLIGIEQVNSQINEEEKKQTFQMIKTYDKDKDNQTTSYNQNIQHTKKSFPEPENEQEKYINKIKNNNDDIEIIISTINDNKRDYSYNSRYNSHKQYDYSDNNLNYNESNTNSKGNYSNHYYYNQNNYNNNYQNSNSNTYGRNSNSNNYYKNQTKSKKISKEQSTNNNNSYQNTNINNPINLNGQNNHNQISSINPNSNSLNYKGNITNSNIDYNNNININLNCNHNLQGQAQSQNIGSNNQIHQTQNPNFFNCNLVSQVNHINFNKRNKQSYTKSKSKKMSKQNHFIYTYEKTNDFGHYNNFVNLNLKFLKQNYKFRDSLEHENQEINLKNDTKLKKGKKKNLNFPLNSLSLQGNSILNTQQQIEYIKYYNQLMLMNQMHMAQAQNSQNLNLMQNQIQSQNQNLNADKENINIDNENEEYLKLSSAEDLININFINPYFLNNLSQAQINYNYNVLMQNSKILNQNEDKIKSKDKNRQGNINNPNINLNNLNNISNNISSRNLSLNGNSIYNNEFKNTNNLSNNENTNNINGYNYNFNSDDNNYNFSEDELKQNININNEGLNIGNIPYSQMKMNLNNLSNLNTSNFFENSAMNLNMQNFQMIKDPKIIEENIISGRYLTGVIRINRCHTHGYITVAGLYNDILIRGNRNLNQSLHCDEVVVELFPMVLWKPLYNKKTRKMSLNNIKEENKNLMNAIQHNINMNLGEGKKESEIDNYEKNLQVKEIVKRITGCNKDKDKDKEKEKSKKKKKNLAENKNSKNEEKDKDKDKQKENLNKDTNTNITYTTEKLEEKENTNITNATNPNTENLETANINKNLLNPIENSNESENKKTIEQPNKQDLEISSKETKTKIEDKDKDKDKEASKEEFIEDENENELSISDSQYEEDEESEEFEKEENNFNNENNQTTNYEALNYFNSENPEMNFKENFKTLEERLNYINQLCNLRPEGRIVKIIKSPNMEKNQIVKIINENSLIFGSPIDENIPKIFIKMKKFRRMEFLRKLENDNFFKGKYFLVKIVGWALNFKCPKGIIINELGNSGDIDVETEVLLRAYEVEHGEEYPKNAQEEIKKFENWEVPKETIQDRHDLREKIIYTIDPKHSKDLDDAISCELIDEESGLLEIGVHIADPSYFIKKDSNIDKEALNRTTTVYLVHKNIPMLPRNLCDNIISLLPNKDRLALSCTFRIYFDGSLDLKFPPKFYLSTINSKAKLDYELAQRILDNEKISYEDLSEDIKPKDKGTFEKIVDSLKNLHKLTKLVRSQRIDSGSLIIENQEINFALNEENKPINFSLKRKLQTNSLVEELMLIANKLSAEFIYNNINNLALIRKHPLLNESKYQEIQKYFKNNKINVDFEDTLELNEMLSKLEKQDKNKYICVQHKLKNFMQRAEYTITKDKDISELKHSALNFDLYTHFTSPIRRYPDLVVHRQLKYILNKMNLLKVNKDDNIDLKAQNQEGKAKVDKISFDEFIKDTDSNENNKNLIENSTLFYNFLMKNVIKKLEKSTKDNETTESKEKDKNLDTSDHYELEHIINYEKHIDHFNERYYNGKQISQKCQKLFQFIFLKNIPEQIYTALIIDISNKIPLKNKRNQQQINFESQTLIISLYIPCLNIELEWSKDDNSNIINYKFNSDTSVSIDYKDELDKNVRNRILKNFDEINLKINPIDTVPIDIKSNLIFS